jgi:hypothetical protein
VPISPHFLGDKVRERELFLKEQLGDIMDGAEPEERKDEPAAPRQLININSPGDQRIFGGDHIELNVYLGQAAGTRLDAEQTAELRAHVMEMVENWFPTVGR